MIFDKASLVLPTFQEKDSLEQVIIEFSKIKEIGEILVVNNNAEPGTSDVIANTSAKELHESRQGYGWAIHCGIQNAKYDRVVVCEPDGTFLPNDFYKLWAYREDVDLIVGSRTVQDFIWKGANMGWHLRWGNWLVAKIGQIIFNSSSLTDVGCTFRLINREMKNEILMSSERLGKKSTYGWDQILLALSSNRKVRQIPVNYKQRIGVSTITGELQKTIKLGISMLLHTISARIGVNKFE